MTAEADFHAKIGSAPAATNELERLVREWRIAADAWDTDALVPGLMTFKDMGRYRRAYVDAERALRVYARRLP